ncbi:hypothetical protein AHAS_Ahas17G0089600 [Arachis hypogaea]
MANVALLDTTFKEYQHALIGALVTTLSNGSVILTIAPNFTMRLSDPTISQRLKIQIQLVGVIQDSNAKQATLHHQVLYRVQDHALDLKLPNTTEKALFMFIDSAGGPAIVNIPKMITTEELSSIILLEWITDYEKAFPKEQIDVHTTTPPTITHNSDGTNEQADLVERTSFRRINIISPVQVQTTHDQYDPPLHFYENEKYVYVSHINGHFIWDVDPSISNAQKEANAQEDKTFSKGSVDYLYQPVNTILCIATLRSYEEEFPPLVTQTDEKKITRRSYVIPQGISSHGHQATTSQEEVLNWHTDNTVSQNKVLLRIDHTLDTLVEKTEGLSVQLSSVAEQVAELRNRLSAQAFQLDQELKANIVNRYFGPEFQKKNRELDQVKAQL